MAQSFPKMLYHVVYEPVIVQNEEEFADHIKKGYSSDRITATEANLIRAKIAWMESELVTLKANLEAMERKASGGNGTDPHEEDEEREATPMIEAPAPAVVKNKGGRPRKNPVPEEVVS